MKDVKKTFCPFFTRGNFPHHFRGTYLKIQTSTQVISSVLPQTQTWKLVLQFISHKHKPIHKNTHNVSYIHVYKLSRSKKSADFQQTTWRYIPEDKNSLFIHGLFNVFNSSNYIATNGMINELERVWKEVVMA
jgi:hypothetical protein